MIHGGDFNNRELVLAAVHQDGCALEFASGTLRNDRELVLAAVHQDGCALEFASKALRNDREVVLAAVQQEGYALSYASAALRNGATPFKVKFACPSEPKLPWNSKTRLPDSS